MLLLRLQSCWQCEALACISQVLPLAFGKGRTANKDSCLVLMIMMSAVNHALTPIVRGKIFQVLEQYFLVHSAGAAGQLDDA